MVKFAVFSFNGWVYSFQFQWFSVHCALHFPRTVDATHKVDNKGAAAALILTQHCPAEPVLRCTPLNFTVLCFVQSTYLYFDVYSPVLCALRYTVFFTVLWGVQSSFLCFEVYSSLHCALLFTVFFFELCCVQSFPLFFAVHISLIYTLLWTVLFFVLFCLPSYSFYFAVYSLLLCTYLYFAVYSPIICTFLFRVVLFLLCWLQSYSL